MRKLYTFTLILIGLGLFAQDATKYPLLEHFTNTKCPICANRNPEFHDLWMMYENEVNHIAIHPKYPYSDCQFYQANTAGNQSRADYYNITGTPTVYLDGVEQSGDSLVEGPAIENAIAQSSYFEIGVIEVEMTNQTQVTVNVTTKGNVPGGTNYKMYVALAEAVIDYNAPNGEDTHYNVFRKFLTPMDGIAFTPPANGMTDSYTYSYMDEGNWNPDEIYAIAYIQNDNTKEIENSGTAETTTTSVSNKYSDLHVSISPNPTDGHINTDKLINQWSLYDLSGRLINTVRLSTASNSIDLPNLDNGIYFLHLQIEGEKHPVMQKVILQN